MNDLFNPETQDLSSNIVHFLLGRYSWYRKTIGGLWRYSTFTHTWWKIIPVGMPAVREEDWR